MSSSFAVLLVSRRGLVFFVSGHALIEWTKLYPGHLGSSVQSSQHVCRLVSST